MTIYGTNKPLGSTDPKDLFDNSQNFDYALNDITKAIWTDRFGRGRQTFWGMEQRFNKFIESSGYKVLGDYAEGPFTLTEYNQLVRYQNELWKLTAATSIPFTTTGNDAASWVNDSVHFVSVGDAALRQQISDPDGAEKYPEFQMARWRDDGDVRGWGAKGNGAADDTAAIDAAFAAKESIYLPEGTFLYRGSIITQDRFLSIRGAGLSLTTLLYRPTSAGTLFDHSHTVANQGVMSLADLTIVTDTPAAGTAIKITALLTSASPQVNGADDTLYLTRVAIRQIGTGYWTRFLHSVNNGGIHLSEVSLNNTVAAAQTDSSVEGIFVETTDSRVSIIRALYASDIYIQRTYYAVKTQTVAARAIESIYINGGEIVGVGKAAFKHIGNLSAVDIDGVHFDASEKIIDCSQGTISLARYSACDFRAGANGSAYVPSPLFHFDWGEMVTFSGCQFSGYSAEKTNPESYVFKFTNAINNVGMNRVSITGSTFRNFHHVYGTTPAVSNIVESGNSYAVITDSICADPAIDTSISMQGAISCFTQSIALTAAASQVVTVNLPTKWYSSALPFVTLMQASGSGNDLLDIIYNFDASTNAVASFTVRGNTTARSVRFGILAVGTNSMSTG